MKNKKEYIYKFEEKDKDGKTRVFAILKPNRRSKEEGELYYASKLSQFIAAGVLPRIVWDKVFKDSGGIISDVDRKQYSSLYIELANLKNELDIFSTKGKSITDEEKQKMSAVEGEIVDIRRQMQQFEMDQINAFENTAEAKARNRTIIWWAANLATEEVEGAFQHLLNGETVEDKLDYYDEIIENDEFLSFVFSRINYLVTIWYVGGASSENEFKLLDEEYSAKLKVEKETDASIEAENSGIELENKKEEITPEVKIEITPEIKEGAVFDSAGLKEDL
jgi:hypothetical protein